MENDQFKLPENAQRELKPGEEYEPILSKNKKYQEVTVWSVCIGLLMTILFSAAAAYLGLKVGQVFEAAIPIAIRRGGRCHLHFARTLHLARQRLPNRNQLLAGVYRLLARRYSRYPVPHPLPQVLRQGATRQVPLPRSHGNNPSFGQRAEEG